MAGRAVFARPFLMVMWMLMENMTRLLLMNLWTQMARGALTELPMLTDLQKLLAQLQWVV